MAELARTITPASGDWLGGRYRILEPLGAGGMGVVDTAFDTKLHRKVAIKRLREAAGGPTGERRRKRFLREAQMLASLSHPNVLTVHDVGEIEREIYVVMELVDGWTMSRWISEAQPRPGWQQIVDMYLQVGPRAVGRAPAGRRSPRRQAREHPGRAQRPRADRRLRPRRLDRRARGVDRRGRRALGADADGSGAGHARVHGARATRRQGERPAVGSVLVLRVAARIAARPPAVPWPDRRRHRRGDARRSAAARAPTAYRARSIACWRPGWPPIRRGGTCRWTRC